ncbi:MAG: type II 3-dehydroquinate dehydratase [Candidatus Margulisiibacteriota bacterium]|nr:MAG: type II 3-dehydroquinate dehydratase [Candidatus Margulisbacteria bacterium GWD2_39_127]OGI03252.1 MAG: type II 3-dehydroquinate dehydratase [Candidatus Margulisbacteria bacterium GWF2_38_17]OGI11275.1 MAG: type II 3-dehydroquinate dehydratase [Candidatus Margulisbacteria bacterium GWE2_39_32]PZM78504.1 MAG: type II 3-dehydroquinate dehydratase [Candidatus Margulisiibacteriota bacterium]HAR63931.1 type II 3-dehydroquinate dehydratase [Candidatus Margulisiibacteriota bacterium]
MNLLIINGPNLNMLGKREPAIYGSDSLLEVNNKIEAVATEKGITVSFVQSNSEGVMIDSIHNAMGNYNAIILNPGAYTHYSLALSDAIASVDIPVIEVHLSNIHAREDYRKTSVTASKCIGQISGFGYYSYVLAIEALCKKLGK